MSDSGGDQNGVVGCHWNLFSVQNHDRIRLAGQDDVNFSVLLVVMLACISADLSQMYRSREFFSISKSSTGYATGTRDPWQRSQIENCWLGRQIQALQRGEYPKRPLLGGLMQRAN